MKKQNKTYYVAQRSSGVLFVLEESEKHLIDTYAKNISIIRRRTEKEAIKCYLKYHQHEWIGLTKEEGLKKAAKKHISARIVEEDDNNYIITHDLQFDRINFEITNNIITNISFY